MRVEPVHREPGVALREVTLGGEQGFKVEYGSAPPAVILMCGLQGSGKTTTTGKLALWMKKNGKNPLLAACDVQRPAAITQLEILGEQVGVPVWQAGPVWSTRTSSVSPSQSSRTSRTRWVWPEVSPFTQYSPRLRLQ